MSDNSQGGSERRSRPARPWIRSHPIRTMFRPGEYRDLRAISHAWGVPLATVVWVIVHDQLARWRKRAPELGEYGLTIAAGLAVTRHATERHRMGAAEDAVKGTPSSAHGGQLDDA